MSSSKPLPPDLPASAGSASYPVPADAGFVQQVRIVAILNAVQGCLEVPMGLFTAGMGAIFPFMDQIDRAFNPGRAAPPAGPPAAFLWLLCLFYLAQGLPVLAGGILRIVASLQNYSFRGRTLGIVSLLVGMSSVLSCYCAPTAIAALVYGLIIMLNPAVAIAFEMRRKGRSLEEIYLVFMPYPPVSYPGTPPPRAEGKPSADQ